MNQAGFFSEIKIYILTRRMAHPAHPFPRLGHDVGRVFTFHVFRPRTMAAFTLNILELRGQINIYEPSVDIESHHMAFEASRIGLFFFTLLLEGVKSMGVGRGQPSFHFVRMAILAGFVTDIISEDFSRYAPGQNENKPNDADDHNTDVFCSHRTP